MSSKTQQNATDLPNEASFINHEPLLHAIYNLFEQQKPSFVKTRESLTEEQKERKRRREKERYREKRHEILEKKRQQRDTVNPFRAITRRRPQQNLTLDTEERRERKRALERERYREKRFQILQMKKEQRDFIKQRQLENPSLFDKYLKPNISEEQRERKRQKQRERYHENRLEILQKRKQQRDIRNPLSSQVDKPTLTVEEHRERKQVLERERYHEKRSEILQIKKQQEKCSKQRTSKENKKSKMKKTDGIKQIDEGQRDVIKPDKKNNSIQKQLENSALSEEISITVNRR